MQRRIQIGRGRIGGGCLIRHVLYHAPTVSWQGQPQFGNVKMGSELVCAQIIL